MTDIDKKLTKMEEQLDAITSSLQSPAPRFLSEAHPDSRFSAASRSDEIDLRELFGILWQGKWWIIAITFLFAVAGVVYALSLPNMYKSEGIYAPAQKEGSGGGMAGQFGGIAAMAGINIGGGSDHTERVVALLGSMGFLVDFVVENNLQFELLAAKEWRRDGGYLWDEKRYDKAEKSWTEAFLEHYSLAEIDYKSAERLKRLLSVSYDKKKGLISVSVQWHSAIGAELWVRGLVAKANAWFMHGDVREAELNFEFLKKQLIETNVTEMQVMLFEMMEAEMRTLMLASARQEYIVKTVVQPLMPVFPVVSGAKVIVILMVLMGVFFGSVAVFLMHHRAR